MTAIVTMHVIVVDEKTGLDVTPGASFDFDTSHDAFQFIGKVMELADRREEDK